MSDPITLTQVAAMAAQLSAGERKQLADSILQDLTRTSGNASPQRRSWHEIRGSLPHPLFGEDAQAFVSRTRRESDDHRERQRRPNR
jgi:hypothetical protein